MTTADENTNLHETLADIARKNSALSASLESERADNEKLQRRNQALLGQIDYLKALIEKLRLGHRSERFDVLLAEENLLPGIDALLTARAEEASDDEEVVEERRVKRKKRTTGRQALPANLERREVVHDVADDDKKCATCKDHEMTLIGAETTEELEIQPEKFFVTAHKRLKYACPCCQRNVVTAPLPARVVPKGIPAASLVAHVLTAKYADHLPLHRQEGIFRRADIEISRQTMCDWVGCGATLLLAIVQELRRQILADRCVRLDATGIKMLAKVKAVRAHLWAYLKKNEIVVYDFTLEHTRDGPEKFLGDYKGYAQVDCDTIYDPMFKAAPHLIEVGCMAHCRRRFFDARETDRDRARTALEMFRDIYRVEAEMKKDGRTAEQRTGVRREITKPLLETLNVWLEKARLTTLPESAIGKAIKYALKHWVELTRFADDGYLEIDNNDTERALRHVAVGRNNWTFAGSEEGGRRTAIVYSIVMTCKLNGVDPFAYLRDVLAERARNPQRDVRELTPMAWKAARAVAVAETSN